MSQMNNTQKTAEDMLPGQVAVLGAKYYYKELDGKLVPLYTKDDFVTAGLSALGDDELQPDDIRTKQELVYPPVSHVSPTSFLRMASLHTIASSCQDRGHAQLGRDSAPVISDSGEFRHV